MRNSTTLELRRSEGLVALSGTKKCIESLVNDTRKGENNIPGSRSVCAQCARFVASQVRSMIARRFSSRRNRQNRLLMKLMSPNPNFGSAFISEKNPAFWLVGPDICLLCSPSHIMNSPGSDVCSRCNYGKPGI